MKFKDIPINKSFTYSAIYSLDWVYKKIDKYHAICTKCATFPGKTRIFSHFDIVEYEICDDIPIKLNSIKK